MRGIRYDRVYTCGGIRYDMVYTCGGYVMISYTRVWDAL